MKKEISSNKIRGALMGVAVGDALGATLEFMSKEEIERCYGTLRDIVGGGFWQLKPGEVTDDTDMTVAVSKGILANPEDPLESIAGEFVKWMRTNPKDAGKICRIVLTEGIVQGARTEADWLKIAEIGHYKNGEKSAGNGSLMRTIPVVLAYWRDREKMISIARRQSALTHFDSTAGNFTSFYCEIVRHVLLGGDLKKVLEESAKEYPVKIDLNCSPEQLKTTGYVVHTLTAAMVCAYQTDSFEEAVIMAVNLGGDTDTIGAVTGGLVGAYYGLSNIPERWTDKLVNKNEILDLADRLGELNISKKG